MNSEEMGIAWHRYMPGVVLHRQISKCLCLRTTTAATVFPATARHCYAEVAAVLTVSFLECTKINTCNVCAENHHK